MRTTFIGAFVAVAAAAGLAYGAQEQKPACEVRAYHAYSECNKDGFWHVVTDAICTDGTVTRTDDKATDQACTGEKKVKAPETRSQFATTMKDCNASYIEGAIWMTECINDNWYNVRYDRRVCANGAIELENPEYHATNKPCGEAAPAFVDTDPGPKTEPPSSPTARSRPHMNKWTKVAIIGGAGGTAAIVAAASGGSSTDTPTTTTPTTPSTTAPGGGIDLTPLFGTFNISATKTVDTGCNFNPTFSGQVQIAGNKDGTGLTILMKEAINRSYSGQMSSGGAYAGTGTANLNGFIENGTISGQVNSTGSAISGTETLNFTAGCPGKSVIYQFTGNK